MFGIVANIVIGLLQSAYGVLAGSAANGGIVVRKAGGTAGSDEIQIYHDGSNGFALCKKGIFVLDAAGAAVYLRTADGTTRASVGTTGNANVLALGSAGTLVWQSSAAPAIGSTSDAGVRRLAAGVLGVDDGTGAGSGWLQNSSGRSVGTAGATNITITPATTGCSVALKAGRKYKFKFVAWHTSVTAADGARFDFDGGTATMTSFMQNGFVTDTAGVRSYPQTTAIATDVTDTTTTGAAMSVFEGYMVVNAAGTFIPRFAKEADAAGATITLNNATLEVEDMP